MVATSARLIKKNHVQTQDSSREYHFKICIRCVLLRIMIDFPFGGTHSRSREGDALLTITLMVDCGESQGMCLCLRLFLQLCTCVAFDCEDTKEAGIKYERGGAGRD